MNTTTADALQILEGIGENTGDWLPRTLILIDACEEAGLEMARQILLGVVSRERDRRKNLTPIDPRYLPAEIYGGPWYHFSHQWRDIISRDIAYRDEWEPRFRNALIALRNQKVALLSPCHLTARDLDSTYGVLDVVSTLSWSQRADAEAAAIVALDRAGYRVVRTDTTVQNSYIGGSHQYELRATPSRDR